MWNVCAVNQIDTVGSTVKHMQFYPVFKLWLLYTIRTEVKINLKIGYIKMIFLMNPKHLVNAISMINIIYNRQSKTLKY